MGREARRQTKTIVEQIGELQRREEVSRSGEWLLARPRLLHFLIRVDAANKRGRNVLQRFANMLRRKANEGQ